MQETKKLSVTVVLGQTCAKGRDSCLTVLHRVKGGVGADRDPLKALLEGQPPPPTPDPKQPYRLPTRKEGDREHV